MASPVNKPSCLPRWLSRCIPKCCKCAKSAKKVKKLKPYMHIKVEPPTRTHRKLMSTEVIDMRQILGE